MSARPRPPGLIVGAWRICVTSWRTQLLSKRMILPALLLCSGPFLACFGSAEDAGPSVVAAGLFHQLPLGNLYRSALPLLVTLLLATAALGDELERRTLIHLYVRPLRRPAVYVAKLVWTVLTAFAGLAMSLVLTWLILAFRAGGSLNPDVLTVHLAVLGLACAVYGTLFFTMALMLPYPTVFGLIYAFGIEGAVAQLPGYFARVSMQFHLKVVHDGLVRHTSMSRLANLIVSEDSIALGSASIVLGSVTAVLAGIGLALLWRREFGGALGRAD